MNTCSCAFLLLLGVAGTALGQTKPKDVYGWGKITWGMTLAQAKAAMGPGARDSDGKASQSTKYTERLVIDKLQVGDTEMAVSVYTLPRSEKVKEVLLTLPAGATGTNGAFEDLRNSLTRKYGSPTRQDSDEGETTTTKSVTWIFPSTVISLVRIQVKRIDVEILNLWYTAAEKEGVGRFIDLGIITSRERRALNGTLQTR